MAAAESGGRGAGAAGRCAGGPGGAKGADQAPSGAPRRPWGERARRAAGLLCRLCQPSPPGTAGAARGGQAKVAAKDGAAAAQPLGVAAAQGQHRGGKGGTVVKEGEGLLCCLFLTVPGPECKREAARGRG